MQEKNTVPELQKRSEARRLLRKYLQILMEVPPDLPRIDEYVNSILLSFKHELISANVAHSQIEHYLSYHLLEFEAELQLLEPKSDKFLSMFLTNHLLLEGYMGRFLIFHLKLTNKEVPPKMSFSNCISQFKRLNWHKFEHMRDFILGLEEIELLRGNLSEDPNYLLSNDDVTSMCKHNFYYKKYYDTQDHDPILVFETFCTIARDYLRAQTWGDVSLSTRISDNVLSHPDWRQFIQRFSDTNSKKTKDLESNA